MKYKDMKSKKLSQNFTKPENSDSSASRGTKSNWDFILIWICTKEFEDLGLVDVGGVVFQVDTVI